MVPVDNVEVSLLDLLFGKPIATSEERAEQIGFVAGIPIFGLDALSSAAYGPEAALVILLPLGLGGVHYIVPICASIIALLIIVFFSYRQTIAAYPGGGGSYTVAHENLGLLPGLLAGAALMIDYILTAAVGISAGVGALVSAVPSLQPRTLELCLAILLIITVVNLRGVRESGGVFMIPTYLFVGSLLVLIAVGLAKSLGAGGAPVPAVPLPPAPRAFQAASAWLLLRAFASGCTAMTGVEAVSNGVRAFSEPTVENARRTLTIVIALLIVLLGGIAYLTSAYQVAARNPDASGYESVLSLLVRAVIGPGVFYFLCMAAVLLALSVSANTAFADFPRLCRAMALDRYLPVSFTLRGRRLVYSQGVVALAVLAGGLLILFRGVTDRLIPLYAIGAFIAFTLSQAGMVAHWRRHRQPGSGRYMIVNAIGAFATGTTAVVVLVAKFAEGAWVTVLLIPLLLTLMLAVHHHYRRVGAELETAEPLDTAPPPPVIALVPLERWSRIAQKAIRFATHLSRDLRVLHVECEETDDFCAKWRELVEEPLRQAGTDPPQLVVLTSPYRMVVSPIVDAILQIERRHPEHEVAVLIPELVERHWYHYFLHNQRATWLKTLLYLKGNQRITVINIPWYLAES